MGIAPISLCTSDVPHTIGKLSTRTRWRLQLCFIPHLNWRFAHKVMGPPKSWESQFWEFRDSHLGVSWQNDIWVLVAWPVTKYTIRGKVVASLKFGPWWVLWVLVYLWLICAPKCSNHALTNLLFSLFSLCE